MSQLRSFCTPCWASNSKRWLRYIHLKFAYTRITIWAKFEPNAELTSNGSPQTLFRTILRSNSSSQTFRTMKCILDPSGLLEYTGKSDSKYRVIDSHSCKRFLNVFELLLVSWMADKLFQTFRSGEVPLFTTFLPLFCHIAVSNIQSFTRTFVSPRETTFTLTTLLSDNYPIS